MGLPEPAEAPVRGVAGFSASRGSPSRAGYADHQGVDSWIQCLSGRVGLLLDEGFECCLLALGFHSRGVSSTEARVELPWEHRSREGSVSEKVRDRADRARSGSTDARGLLQVGKDGGHGVG